MQPRNRQESELASDRAKLIYCAGCDWDDIRGADKQSAARLPKYVGVLWIDSPESILNLISQLSEAASGRFLTLLPLSRT